MKTILVGLTVLGFVFALSAGPVARIDFPCPNFFGTLTTEDKLPDGVWIGERAAFHDKSKKGYSFPVFVDLAKTSGFEATFVFSGTGTARTAPAITGYDSDAERSHIRLNCLEFEIDGDKSSKVPCKFSFWTGLLPFVASEDKKLPTTNSMVSAGQKYWPIIVKDGRTMKVKAKFGK